MRIIFHGGASAVTGSCYELHTPDLRLLIDCGMFQGDDEELNRHPFQFDPREIDYVILTHCHIDHAGLLPKLVNEGFRGSILATHGTADLCDIILPDSGRIQESEYEWRNRKGRRIGEEESEPLYTETDARNCLGYIRGVDYDENIELSDSTTVAFRNSGHILGSAFVEFSIKQEGAEPVRITFSGDLGNFGQPIIKDPSDPNPADIVLIEGTYGNRLHEPFSDRSGRLADVINTTLEVNGNIIIPSFAVGRTQDLIYEIIKLQQDQKIPRIPVYIDSPMAVSATEIYKVHREYFDPETEQLLKEARLLFDNPMVHYVQDSAASRALNGISRAIIISSSGMCEVGRILHHLKHNLWRRESTILFVGYQAEGTLGRRLLSGEPFVQVMGETIAVKARIERIESFSAHGDQHALLEWLKKTGKPRKTFLVHGEIDGLSRFRHEIQKALEFDTDIPGIGSEAKISQTVVSMSKGTMLKTSAEKNRSHWVGTDSLKRLSSISARLAHHPEIMVKKDIPLDEIDTLTRKLTRLLAELD